MHTQARLRLCLLLCLSPLPPVAARLVYLQILQHKDLSSRARSSIARQLIEIVPRGRILDREGRVLAQSLPAWSSFLDLKALREDGKSEAPKLKELAVALGIDGAALAQLMKSKSRNVWLKRKMSYEEVDRLKALKMRSIGIVVDERRFYPNGELSRPLLGAIDAQDRGSAGLEYAFNKELRGRAVRWSLTRDGTGRAILHEPEQERESPPDLHLTIDRTLQFFAEKALEETVRRWKAKSGSVLIQDPRSGELLAMAVYPPDPFRNSAVQDLYEPGSTFKVVTAAAALESNVLKPGEKIDCEYGKWQVTPSVRIKDHDPLGPLSLAEIVQYSSNIGSAKLGLRLGAETLHRYARQFGFGYKTGIPLPAENWNMMFSASLANRVGLANVSFGQGVAVTPLQLIGAYSAIANGGILLEPRIVLRGGAVERPTAASESGISDGAIVVRRVMRPETAKQLQKMLEAVVLDGTGASAQIPGYLIAGKTGTAQKIDPLTKEYSASDYVSSFAGYVPADDPRYTLLVVIDSPRQSHYGSIVAAPLFKTIVRQILAIRGIAPNNPMPLWLNGEGGEARRAAPVAPKALPPPSPRKDPVPAGEEAA